MRIQLALRNEQLEDLAVLRDLGSQILASVIDHLQDMPKALLKPAELRKALKDALPARENEADILYRQLLSLYALQRQRRFSSEQVLAGLRYGIEHAPKELRWTEKQLAAWDKLDPELRQLLSLKNVWLVAKATDLAYEYSNLFEDARVITDIRPLFNQQATALDAAVISFTLRLYFDSREHHHSLSIAMDEPDIKHLKAECERALAKAQTARKRMVAADVPTLISGRNDDEPS